MIRAPIEPRRAGLPDPPDRPRHRRDAGRRRPGHRAADPRRGPRGGRSAASPCRSSPVGWSSSAMRFARELGLTDPVVGYQGGLVRAMPPEGSTRLGKLLVHTPLPAVGRARDRRVDRRPRPRPAPQPPRAVHPPRRRPAGRRLLRVHGRARRARPATWPARSAIRSRRSSRSASRRSRRRWRRSPRPHFAGDRRRDDQPSALPRVRRARRVEGPGRPRGSRGGWACRSGGRSRSATSGTTSRCSPRSGHGAAMPTAPAGVRAVARYVAPPVGEEGVAALIESLVLAAADGGPRGVAPAVGRGGRRARGRRRGLLMARIVADDPAGRAIAIDVLRGGGIVALPTDTVYGIARRAGHARRHRAPVRGEGATARQGRSCCCSTRWPRHGRLGIMGPAAEALAAAFWPGGLTLVVAQRPDVHLPACSPAGAPTIGLRVPDHDAPRALARDVGPLPVTSANISGRPEGRDAAEIDALLRATRSSSSSTAAPPTAAPPRPSSTASGDRPRVLRPGAIPVVASCRDPRGRRHRPRPRRGLTSPHRRSRPDPFVGR